ncbi:uncharacterized protein PV06_05892 [Exophiala oligosperma]|uniref:Zn(2)-C6 fungal-type domain-containing protein n=1 Tax=Exophiala oligosperma TaxID=215243 RepID=A0A0D2DIP7_9EURO|nr:uncharacterized protein PV06_05892 [Exophiala oligosperma]KIW42330.1 hypothetical protein PV06_05892 [Exophiala oligosperma]
MTLPASRPPDVYAGGIGQRPYRSRRQKPCNACRQRRSGCVRRGTSACTFCTVRGLDCVVDSTATTSPNSRTNLAPAVITNVQARRAEQELLCANPGQPKPSPTRPSAIRARSDDIVRSTLQYIGPTSDHDSFILRHSSLGKSSANSPSDADWACQRISTDPRNPVHFSSFPDEHLDARPYYYPRNIVEEAVRSFRDDLVHAFFEYVHPSMALLGPQQPSTLAKSATLMASIYALAQRHCPAARDVDPWLFTDFNKQALNIETHTVKLETVEAALLFAQRHPHVLRAPNMPGVSAEVGGIIGMGHDLGLNIDPIDWDISDTERRRRRRLWWGIFIQDKWFALTLGRPSYLQDDQNNVSMLTQADFAAEGFEQPSKSQSQPANIFIGMATLSVILSRICREFFTVKSTRSFWGSIAELQHAWTLLEEDLDRWYATFLEPLLASKGFPDPTGSLELAFYTVQITLCRGALRIVLSQFSTDEVFWKHLRQRGKTAALSVVRLLDQLPVARSSAFWWSASRLNFSIAGSFMISMFLCSVSDEESQYWMDQIAFYRKLLRAHATGFEVTKHASIRLDLLADRGGVYASSSTTVSEQCANDPQPVYHQLSTQTEDNETAATTSATIDILPAIDPNEDWLVQLPSLSPFGVHDFGLV